MKTLDTRPRAIGAEAHRVYRALIDHMTATGAVPDRASLAATTGYDGARVSELLDELAERDWIGRGDGRIVALYPFSPVPTGIEVQLDGGISRHAMCAIDALGTAPMLGRAVTVESACVLCNTPIRIDLTPERIKRRRPRSTVVIRRRTAGSAYASRCATTRFACSPDHAQAWLAEFGGPEDIMQSIEAAFIEAERRFGGCYTSGDCGQA